MLKWLLPGRVRESWARYSVAVYLGLLLAGTLSAEPPVPPHPESDQFPAEPPAPHDDADPPGVSDPLTHVQQR